MKTNALNWRACANRTGLWFVALLCLVPGSGCSTILSHREAKGSPPVCGGVKMDCHFIQYGSTDLWSGPAPGVIFIFVVYGVIDCPLSAVADTLCLPYDLAVAE